MGWTSSSWRRPPNRSEAIAAALQAADRFEAQCNTQARREGRAGSGGGLVREEGGEVDQAEPPPSHSPSTPTERTALARRGPGARAKAKQQAVAWCARVAADQGGGHTLVVAVANAGAPAGSHRDAIRVRKGPSGREWRGERVLGLPK